MSALWCNGGEKALEGSGAWGVTSKHGSFARTIWGLGVRHERNRREREARMNERCPFWGDVLQPEVTMDLHKCSAIEGIQWSCSDPYLYEECQHWQHRQTDAPKASVGG